MNYNIFIQQHPLFDLLFEIFKGVSPTIMALLAIYINNKIARRREKNKIKVDTLLFLQNQSAELECLVYSVGNKFLEYMYFYVAREEEEKHFDEYRKASYEMLMFSRKILFYTKFKMAKVQEEEIEFNKCFSKISEYNKKIDDLMNEYTQVTSCTYEVIQNKLEKQVKMISEDVEKEILDYTKILSNIINSY